ncbi:hypothetical protein DOY81_009074 [Sarcophaga bullata]|nr:hypothetical protein DOY81_009074 [Sarcophaga bullata]
MVLSFMQSSLGRDVNGKDNLGVTLFEAVPLRLMYSKVTIIHKTKNTINNRSTILEVLQIDKRKLNRIEQSTKMCKTFKNEELQKCILVVQFCSPNIGPRFEENS